ncbi:hypothetical protein Q3304_08595 [Clostridioides sp. GD02377]|uniref:hypothetical protein n=1 Tax=unclassified Clostridioides TaxID=2635829 RepID=UPI0038A5F58E
MILNKAFENKKEIKRTGAAKKIIINNHNENEYSSKLNIHSEEKIITVINGNKRIIATDKIGIIGLVKLDLFFVTGGFVIDLKKGVVVIEKSDGIYIIGKKKPILISKEHENFNSINWQTKDDLSHYLKILTAKKFDLKEREIINNYLNNLTYSLEFNNSKILNAENSLMKIYVNNIYNELGCDTFKLS